MVSPRESCLLISAFAHDLPHETSFNNFLVRESDFYNPTSDFIVMQKNLRTNKNNNRLI